MKTRRKSKAATAAGDDTPSSPAAETSGATALSLTLPDDLDVDTLSSLLPEMSIESPRAEDVLFLYQLIVSRDSELEASRRDLEESHAELQRKEVELDQALQDRESSGKEVEKELSTAQEDLKNAKKERDELFHEKSALQQRLDNMESSSSVSLSEVSALKQQLSDVQREKRELLSIIGTLKSDGASQEEELHTLRASLKQARGEYQALETEVRELRSKGTSTQFKLESLEQRLQLSKEEAERATTELNTKSEQFAADRRAIRAEHSRLQANHDILLQEKSSIEGQLQSLQSSFNSQSHQLLRAQSTVQDLRSRLAEKEATYSGEVANLKRLIEMMEDREKEAKAIVDGIESEWASVGERAERREAVLREEIDRAKRRTETAERRVEEMERVLERVNRGDFPVPPPSTPGTPLRNGTPESLAQGVFGLSPAVAMASKVQRSGKTFTEVYADHIKLQEEYARKCAEYDRMDRTLAEVLAQIEERAPVLAQQRAEYERLQEEANQLASQLSYALTERDASSQSAQEAIQKLAKTSKENQLLTHQLDDLGKQIQSLLKEVARARDPMLPTDEELENDTSVTPAANIDEVITNQLVLFRSIGGLQERNQQLLQLVRRLGDQMETEERDYKMDMEKEQAEAIREAHDAIQELQARLETEKKTGEIRVHALIKERDSLKTLLERAQRAAPANVQINGQGHNSAQPSAGDSELQQELAEIQSQFDLYKTEMGVDAGRLREENIAAQRDIAQLTAALAKSAANVEFLNVRQKSDQERYAAQTKEIESLAKRNSQLHEQYARADIQLTHIDDELSQAKSRLEQMRHENANLRAEKQMLETAQSRLAEQNQVLSMERSQLQGFMDNVKNMHTELERANENDRRRLERQIQMLETQSQDLKKQLGDERENLRHITLQREIEVKELRTTLDKNTELLSTARESLVKAETSKSHLEERVEALSRQLQGNAEKLAVYERRGSSLSGSAPLSKANADMPRDQQLEAEVAELRSALKVAEVDLANARMNVIQFQEISKASETALEQFTAMHEEYKSRTDIQIAQLESDRTAMEKDLARAQEELATAKQSFAEFKRASEADHEAWLADKRTLEDSIVELTTSKEAFAENQSNRDATAQQQTDRMREAEERYSREVLAHAEAIKSIDELKLQVAELQKSSRDRLAEAEAAKGILASSETSWTQQRQTLEKELDRLNARCQDLVDQNKVLHGHLESVSSQAAKIRSAASAAAEDGISEADGEDTKLAELRQVIGFLRREKEIVEMQLVLAKQETDRLRGQSQDLTRDLDETRIALAEERERAVAAATTDAQHAELVEKINQLTVLRESNATLRTESEAHAKRSRELNVQVKKLSEELDPLRTQVRVLQAEVQSSSAHVKKLEEENKKWQERNVQLLSKYDRIDPAEVQALKDELGNLRNEKAQWEASVASQTVDAEAQAKKITELEQVLIKHKESRQKLLESFRSRVNQEKAETQRKVGEVQARLDAVTAERDGLQSQSKVVSDGSPEKIAELVTELEQVKQALDEEKARKVEMTNTNGDSTALQERITALSQERDALLKKLLDAEAALAAAAASNSTVASSGAESKQLWEAERAELVTSRDAASNNAQVLKEQLDKLNSEIRGLKQQNETFRARLRDQLQSQAKLKEEHEVALKTAVDKANKDAAAATSAGVNAPDGAALVAKHAEELHALESRLHSEHQAALKKALEETSGAADQAAAIEKALAEKTAELQKAHLEELAKATENGRMEGNLKLRMKDSQIVKFQGRVKQLEAKIQEWTKEGKLPADALGPSPASASTGSAPSVSSSVSAPSLAASTSSAPPIVPQAAMPPPATPAATPSAPVTRSVARGAAPATAVRGRGGTAASTAPAGRGRGRGGAMRGGGVNRGAAPSAAAATAASQAATTTNMSIIGAAGKRAREETGDTSTGDSLAKRLKPAEGKPPVQLNRNRTGGPPPSS